MTCFLLRNHRGAGLRSASPVVFALVLSLYLLLDGLLFSSAAFACTPPALGWQNLRLWEDESGAEMPADGVVVFAVRDGGGEYELSVVVSSGDAEVSGELEWIEDHRDRRSPSWIECPPEEVLTDYLGVWRPSEPFDAGEVYSVVVIGEQEHVPGTVEASRDFLVVEAAGDAGTLGVGALALQARAVGEEYECCCCATCCGVCPSDDGRHCWYVADVNQPELQGLAQGPAFPHQMLYRVFDGDGVEVGVVWGGASSEVRVLFPAEHERPYCLSVEAESLASGEVRASEEGCVEDAEGLSFGLESFDLPRPLECDDEDIDIAEEADDPTQDVGNGADDVDQPISGAQGATCMGCAALVPGTSPGGPWLLLVLVGLWFASSRTRRRRGRE